MLNALKLVEDPQHSGAGATTRFRRLVEEIRKRRKNSHRFLDRVDLLRDADGAQLRGRKRLPPQPPSSNQVALCISTRHGLEGARQIW